MERSPILTRLTFLLLFIILAVYATVMTRDLLYPIFIAILFSYLLYPAASFFERYIPRPMAILLSVVIFLGLIYLGIKLTISQLTVFVDNMPLLQEQAVDNFDHIVEDLAELVNMDVNVLRDRFLNGITESQGLANTVLNATTGTIVKLGLIPVYMFFLLLYRDRFHNFVLKLTDNDERSRMVHIMDEIRMVSKQYIGGVFVVVSILCVLNSLGLYIIGLKYAILLGILSAVMNFIPYFGTLIGAAIPMAYTLVSPHPEHFIKVAILFVIIQFLENNILTPNITGNQVRLNPFVTIISIVIGGMLWGIPGMFLSVPVMGVIYVICKNVPKLDAWAYILGADDDEKTQSIFKKLLYRFKNRKANAAQ